MFGTALSTKLAFNICCLLYAYCYLILLYLKELEKVTKQAIVYRNIFCPNRTYILALNN